MDLKCKGLNSLPGGHKNYLNFLAKALSKIEQDKPSRSELFKWMKKEFRVGGKESGRDYIHIMLMLDLIKDDYNILSLTQKGQEFLKTNDAEIIFESLLKNFYFFEEILNLLKVKPGATAEEIGSFLSEKSGVTWKKVGQVQKRLLWLRAVGRVEKVDNRYFLT